MALGGSTRQLTLKLVAETQDMTKEVKGVSSKLGGMTKGLLAAGAAGAAAFATSTVVDFGKSVIEEASNIAESTSKIKTVFGESAKGALSFAKNANKSLGLADEEALGFVGTLGSMFTGLGKTQAEASGLSQQTISLAADLGSFNNVSTPETLDMMSAAFRGEYDSIQKMLPGLNAAAVQTEALAMTGKTNASELTEQEKAMATLQLMTKQAGPAMGDFARTSGGAANQQKILASQIEDAKGAIGAKLLPAFAATLNFINDKLIPGIGAFIDWIKGPFVDGIKVAWEFVWQYIERPVKTIMSMIDALWDIIRNLVQLVVNVFTGDWQGAWDNIKNIFKGVVQYITGWVSLLWQYIQMYWNLILGFLKTVGGWILDAVLWPFKTAWDLIKWYVTTIVEGVKSAWDGMWDALSKTGKKILDIIKWPFETAWSFIKDMWNKTFGNIHITIPDIPGFPGRGQTIGFPKLAQGGIVRKPTLALIGEAGPEAVIPLGHRTATTGGGNVYNINVKAGVGDPVEIGRKVVSAIKAYERVSGPRSSGAYA